MRGQLTTWIIEGDFYMPFNKAANYMSNI